MIRNFEWFMVGMSAGVVLMIGAVYVITHGWPRGRR